MPGPYRPAIGIDRPSMRQNFAQEMPTCPVYTHMRRVFETALGRSDLHVCPTCRQPFVAPREILAEHDDGQLVVDLGCANCGWSAVQLHDTFQLCALDRALDRDSARIEAAADALALSCELERIDRFAEALRVGHILPEDF
jgi:hypothetical protein